MFLAMLGLLILVMFDSLKLDLKFTLAFHSLYFDSNPQLHKQKIKCSDKEQSTHIYLGKLSRGRKPNKLLFIFNETMKRLYNEDKRIKGPL